MDEVKQPCQTCGGSKQAYKITGLQQGKWTFCPDCSGGAAGLVDIYEGESKRVCRKLYKAYCDGRAKGFETGKRNADELEQTIEQLQAVIDEMQTYGCFIKRDETGRRCSVVEENKELKARIKELEGDKDVPESHKTE